MGCAVRSTSASLSPGVLLLYGISYSIRLLQRGVTAAERKLHLDKPSHREICRGVMR